LISRVTKQARATRRPRGQISRKVPALSFHSVDGLAS
jgi:hypothetical protein